MRLAAIAAFVALVGPAALQDREGPTPAARFAERREAERLAQSADVRAMRVATERLLALWNEEARRELPDGSLALAAANGLVHCGRLAEAIPLFELAYDGGWDARYELAYALAQLHAQASQPDDALRWLERSLAHRWVDRPGIANDAAFATLRDAPATAARFRELAGQADTAQLSRDDGWRLDLDHYAAEVRRMCANPEAPHMRPEFAAALASLRGRVAELGDAAIALELQKITVLLGDGHSTIYMVGTPRLALPVLPITTYFFAEGLFVVDSGVGGRGPGAELIGHEIVSIGGMRAAELLAALAPYVSRDNAMGVRWLGPLFLRSPVVLRAIGAIGPESPLDRVTLSVRAPGEAVRDVTLAVQPFAQRDAGSPRLAAPPGTAPGAAPLWLARPHEPFWFEERPDRSLLYVQVNEIGDAAKQTLEGFAAEVRETLRESGLLNLVLDLRQNSGGNNFLVAPLVRLVAWFEEDAPEHRVFVVTGRKTFSACQNLVNRLERNTRVTIVGEPSSSKPNFTGESTELLLPWSGLRGSISSRWWQDSFPEDARPFIAPHLRVDLRAADWIANHDPVLAAIEEAIAADG